MVHVSHLRDKIEEATGGEKSFKPFGEWAIKLTQDSKRATEKRRRINLTSKEISELLAEGIITIILCFY